MTDFLAEACDAARRRAAELRDTVGLDALRRRAGDAPPVPDFAEALAGPDVAVIAEIKRASPSRGQIAAIPDAGARARAYVAGGAEAVSVLTEPDWFAGSLADLTAVADTGAPALCKDFVVDEAQVLQARAAGASAVLLIVAAVEDETLTNLLRAVGDAGLDALVEVHAADQMHRAAAAHAAAGTGRPLVLGVNARDLSTLDVDPERFARLRGLLPAGALAVAESGIAEPADVGRLGRQGADAVLVGEYAAAADDPEGTVRGLVEAGRRVPSGT